jgi:hypothetical protein
MLSLMVSVREFSQRISATTVWEICMKTSFVRGVDLGEQMEVMGEVGWKRREISLRINNRMGEIMG